MDVRAEQPYSPGSSMRGCMRLLNIMAGRTAFFAVLVVLVVLVDGTPIVPGPALPPLVADAISAEPAGAKVEGLKGRDPG